jgi:hypothetical protein
MVASRALPWSAINWSTIERSTACDLAFGIFTFDFAFNIRVGCGGGDLADYPAGQPRFKFTVQQKHSAKRGLVNTTYLIEITQKRTGFGGPKIPSGGNGHAISGINTDTAP